jgi:hypothetical protein
MNVPKSFQLNLAAMACATPALTALSTVLDAQKPIPRFMIFSGVGTLTSKSPVHSVSAGLQ